MKHAFYCPDRTIIKTIENDSMKTPWKNLEEQYYSQKRMNLNSGIIGMSFAKMWRRKPDCEQTESVDTEQSKYFSMSECLHEEDLANIECSDHVSIEIFKKEATKLEPLIEDEQCEWAL